VDPAYEITALVVKLEREAKRRPVLLFEKVKGTRFPVLTNLHASRGRLAAAMSAAPEETLRTYLRAMETPTPPKVVGTGPVKEVVLTGDRVNLYDLPQIVHHEGDAGPYVTAAISFAKAPTADIWNCAYNRLQIKTRDTTSIHLTTGKHLWEFHRIAEARGEPLPGRDLPLPHRRPPRPPPALDDPDRGEPLPCRPRDGPDGAGGARAGSVHVLRLDRGARPGPGEERDPRGAGCRPLCEARGGRRPRRGRVRRPSGELGDRHAMPARP